MIVLPHEAIYVRGFPQRLSRRCHLPSVVVQRTLPRRPLLQIALLSACDETPPRSLASIVLLRQMRAPRPPYCWHDLPQIADTPAAMVLRCLLDGSDPVWYFS